MNITEGETKEKIFSFPFNSRGKHVIDSNVILQFHSFTFRARKTNKELSGSEKTTLAKIWNV